MRERVRVLIDEGRTYRQIAARLGVGTSTVAFHARRLDLPPDPRFSRRFDWKAIQAAYDSGFSMRQCMKRFGFSSASWYQAVERGEIKPRPAAMPIEKLLVVGRKTSRNHLKHRLMKEGLKTNRCEICGITEWLGRPLNMQLHHVNGNGADNRLENIKFLCGNCHSQTDTYGGRNGHRRSKAHLTLVASRQDKVA